jgi:hypothetical protein
MPFIFNEDDYYYEIIDGLTDVILVTIIMDGVTYYVSKYGAELKHYWDAKITSFSSPVAKTKTRYGGMCSFEFGSIGLSPDFFTGIWPPAINATVKIYKTISCEASKEELFIGTMHLERIGKEEISYQLYPYNFDTDLLDKIWPYDDSVINLNDGSTYEWEQIGVTNEYFCRLQAGGGTDPSFTKPSVVSFWITPFTEGSAVGSLAVGEWIFDDPGTEGFETIIVRMSDNSNPDSQVNGWVKAEWNVEQKQASKAFGPVVHAEAPQLLPCDTNFPVYHKAGVQGHQHSRLNTSTAASKLIDSWGGFTIYNIAVGDRVRNVTASTETTVTAVDSYTQLSLAADIFPVAGGINKEYSVGNCGEGASDTWCVYDDGVDISTNVMYTPDSKDVFMLNASPVGKVTISGTGEDSKLVDIFDWAKTRVNDAEWTSVDDDLANNSLTVSYLADSQEGILAFLSRLAASTNHFFYFKDTVCYLNEMSMVDTITDLDNYDNIDMEIEYGSPVAEVSAEWTLREAAVIHNPDIPGDSIGSYILERPETAVVESDYTYGDKEEISEKDLFQYSRAEVMRLLHKVLFYLNSPDVILTMPFNRVVTPGEKFVISDETFHETTVVVMTVREIHYDVDNYEIQVIGEKLTGMMFSVRGIAGFAMGGLVFSLPAGKSITINWGDGQSTTKAGAFTEFTFSHYYQASARYIATVSGDYSSITYVRWGGYTTMTATFAMLSALMPNLTEIDFDTEKINGAFYDLPSLLEILQIDTLYPAYPITGKFSDLPDTITYIYLKNIALLSITDTLSNLPASVTTLIIFDCDGHSITGGSSAMAATAIEQITIYNLFSSEGYSAASLDSILERIYTDRMLFTDATPALNIGGASNATPSGVYQYAAAPSTGLEYAYALENDDDGEGFNTWNITYTA